MIKLHDFKEVGNFRDNYKNLNNEKVIYIFLYDGDVQRLVGKSPILKIGETLDFKKRMCRYFNEENIKVLESSAKRKTAYRLRNFFDNKAEKNIRLYYKSLPNASKKDLLEEEKKLLMQYMNEHLETPPLNMGLR
jgi:hypothetical protein